MVFTICLLVCTQVARHNLIYRRECYESPSQESVHQPRVSQEDTDENLEERLEIYKLITDVYEKVLMRLPSMDELNFYLKRVVTGIGFDVTEIEMILRSSSEFIQNEASSPESHIRFSPMDPNYYKVPITTNIMDVFFETSKCVKKATEDSTQKKKTEFPMISGIAFDDETYHYKQPLAKYSSDRNMNELMGNIARNTYYLNNKADVTEQIVSQPVIYPSNMSENLLTDLENIMSNGTKSSEAGAPYD